jgi:hypothetical protein
MFAENFSRRNKEYGMEFSVGSCQSAVFLNYFFISLRLKREARNREVRKVKPLFFLDSCFRRNDNGNFFLILNPYKLNPGLDFFKFLRFQFQRFGISRAGGDAESASGAFLFIDANHVASFIHEDCAFWADWPAEIAVDATFFIPLTSFSYPVASVVFSAAARIQNHSANRNFFPTR